MKQALQAAVPLAGKSFKKFSSSGHTYPARVQAEGQTFRIFLHLLRQRVAHRQRPSPTHSPQAHTCATARVVQSLKFQLAMGYPMRLPSTPLHYPLKVDDESTRPFRFRVHEPTWS